MKISSVTAQLPQPQLMALSLDGEQESQELTIQILEPEEGLWLTQIKTSDIERVFSQKVFLAQGSTPEEWTEWTEEKKDAHELLQEQLFKEMEMGEK